jgi:hypothetical protein
MQNHPTQQSLYSLQRELNSNLARAGRAAANWLNTAPLYLCTKTTGSGKSDQLIELSILDSEQRVLFHSQILPTVAIDAENRHGINLTGLLQRPKWPALVAKVMELLKGRKIIIFNALFETRILKQTSIAYGLGIDWVDSLEVNCAMYLAANAYGSDNRYGSVSMAYAMKKAKVAGFDSTNGTVADCYALVRLATTIASSRQVIKQRIAQLSLKIAV